MRVVHTAPVYWPSTSFGGPVQKLYELAKGLVARGHTVDVMTTSIESLDERPDRASRADVVEGATVHYLGTPLRYRWIGVTPALRRSLAGLDRPEVMHVFGFRDYVGTSSARWARQAGLPYVFEGLGMVRPKLHKVALKRALDATLYRRVLDGAALFLATSNLERDEYIAAGLDPLRIVVRPNGFPPPVDQVERPGPLRHRLGLDESVPLLLSVGRITEWKGIDLAIRSLPELDGVHLAVVGPDERGTTGALLALARRLRVGDRVHILGPWPAPPLELYGDADVFVLASAYESFGTAAAEAAAAGTAIVVTDRCGIADLLADGAGIVVPYDQPALASSLSDLLGDGELRRRLAGGARELAARWSWPRVVELQESIYREALERD